MRFILTTLLLTSFYLSVAQNIIIRGTSKSYAGDELELYTVSDNITYSREIIATAKVDTTGCFEFKVTSPETIQVFIELDIFIGYLYVEPNKEYQILLPTKKVKTIEQVLNPYFQKEMFHILLLDIDNSDINAQIGKFDKFYSKSVYSVLKTKQTRYRKSFIDSTINNIDTAFQEIDNQYFLDYKKYRYARFYLITRTLSKEDLISEYFVGEKILYNNTAYMTTFMNIFTDIFTYKSDLASLPRIYDCIRYRSYYKLKNTLSENELFENNNFSDLVILRGLHDVYHKKPSSQYLVLAIIDSMQTVSRSKKNRNIAKSIYHQLTNLRNEFPAPIFELYNKDNKNISLRDYEGKFVYLNFYHPESHTCQQEILLLEKLNSQNIDLLKIVTIYIGENISEMQKFQEENQQYKWTFLFCKSNTQIISDYKVKVFPSYFLIDPAGILVKNPVPSPADNFEGTYISAYKNWKRQQEIMPSIKDK